MPNIDDRRVRSRNSTRDLERFQQTMLLHKIVTAVTIGRRDFSTRWQSVPRAQERDDPNAFMGPLVLAGHR